jgi:hypothetical protein
MSDQYWNIDQEKFNKICQDLDDEFENILWPMLEAMGFEIPMEES